MFLNLLIDVILITIILGGSCIGYRRGLFKMTTGLLKGLTCLLIAFYSCELIGERLVSPLIRLPISRFFEDFLKESLNGASHADIPTVLKILGAVFGLSYEPGVTYDTLNRVVGLFTEPLVSFISRSFSFVVIYLTLRCLIKLLISILDSVLSIGVIGTINRILGATASVFIALIFAVLFTSTVDFLFQTDIFYKSRLVQDFSGGPIYRFFKKFSLLRLLLSF